MNAKLIVTAIVSSAMVALGSSLPASAKDAVLKSNFADSRINFRSTPSVNSTSRGFGLPGDYVRLVSQRTGTNGKRWYYIQSYRTGAEGWTDGTYVQPINSLPIGGPASKEPITQTSKATRYLINHYEVRVFSSRGQTRLNAFNRQTNKTELRSVPVSVLRSTDGVTYEGSNVVMFISNNGEKTITLY